MRKFFSIIFILVFLLFVYNCDTDSKGVNSKESTGQLSILLTDAPAVYDSVIITFSEISAHIDSDWVTVMHDPIRVDLLEWSNGRTLVLGSSDVPTGKYTQIRVKIDSAEIGVDGLVYPLDVPSGAKTGLKFGPQFTISEGSTFELVMDFDVNRSIVIMGSEKDPEGYKLKPRIRVISKAVTGSISGIILNHGNLPVSYAINGTDTLTSSLVDTTDGSFLLSFLPENTYKVVVVDTIDQRYEQEGVVVVKGQNNDLGDITLQ
jgi:hypothetical protein